MDKVVPIAGRMSNDADFRKFEVLLDAHMAAQGLNDRTLSLAAGVSADYVNKLRKRKSRPKIDFLAKLAKALRVEPTALMPGAPIPPLPSIPAGSRRRLRLHAPAVEAQHLKTAIYSASLIYLGRANLTERELAEFAEHAAAVYARLLDTRAAKTA